ncbi:hypothetical protein CC80DRAFT_530799 [Byssothecium circinans]|uniref:Uncharacterized protein n=1 Tax=Byssothecium circinans TaxID=147558 RepID=A0A6A5UDA5_9PLEO|nr:hypothetical protein CC80DRAFT_530799 [Byssothecium circinans]
MANDGSDFSDDYVDDRDQGSRFDTELLKNTTKGSEKLNIDPKYQPHWGPAEGFREDATCHEHGISEADFITKTQSTKEVLYTVHHPTKTPPQLVPWIRFGYNPKTKLGHYEMANTAAMLKRQHLSFGGTSKAHDNKQIGQHGEGLKLAALVSRRHPHNHSFAVTTGEVSLTFGWDKYLQLQCQFRKISEEKMVKAKKVAKKQDKRMYLNKVSTKEIALDDFLAWTKMTLDIEKPNEIIRTKHGDLILAPDHRNTLYLHGLRLDGGSKCGKKFMYSYNLRNVRTGRDRETVANANSEAEMIAKIWRAALQKEQREGKSVLLERYVDLLRNHFDGAAEMHDVHQHILKDTAVLVWGHMIQPTDGRNPFYYCGDKDSKGAEIIQRHLERHPISLKSSLWDILRSFKLCLTPTEECNRIIQHAREVSLATKDVFAQNILWTLKALLHLLPLSSKLPAMPPIVAVEANNVGIIVYHDTKFKIVRKWFTHEGAHEATYCDEEKDQDSPDNLFTCDHAVLWLWDTMLATLQQMGHIDLNVKEEGSLKAKARAKLQQMPRAITFETYDIRMHVIVRWWSMEAHLNAHRLVKATLHSPDCMQEYGLRKAPLLNDPSKPCDCTTQCAVAGYGEVSLEVGFHTDKDNGAWVTVSRDEQDAIFRDDDDDDDDDGDDDYQPEGNLTSSRTVQSSLSPSRFTARRVMHTPASNLTHSGPSRTSPRPSRRGFLSDANPAGEQEGDEVITTRHPSFNLIANLFASLRPEGCIPHPYTTLNTPFFPLEHTWLSLQQGESELLIDKKKGRTATRA